MIARTLLAAALSAVLALPVLAEPQRGGTLRMALDPEPASAIVALSGTGATQIFASKIFEALLTFDFDLNPQPWLAESWEADADGLGYTFHLVRNATWHDGQPFTARDVLVSFDLQAELNPRLAVVRPRIESIEAVDDHTVRFRFNRTIPGFLYLLHLGTLSILPAHLYEGQALRDNPANRTPVGTGPFLLKEWAAGSHIHLVRNDSYRDGTQPYLDEIYFVLIPDPQGRAVAFEQGTVDVVSASNLEAFDIPRLAALPGVETEARGWEIFSPHAHYWINTKRPGLDDVNLRRALAQAIDGQFVRDAIFNGYGTVPIGPIGSRTRFHDPEATGASYDPDAARAALAASSYDGRELTLIPAPVGSSFQRLAEYQVQAWREIGINVRIEAMDIGSAMQRQAERNYDLAQTYLYQHGDPSIGVTQIFYSGNDQAGSPWNNVSGYSNPEVDALMAEADSSIDPEHRARLYARIQATINADAPVGQLIELDFPTLYHGHVHDLITTGTGLNDSFAGTWISK